MEIYELTNNQLQPIPIFFSSVYSAKTITCGVTFNDRIFTGTDIGELLEWNNEGIKRTVNCFQSEILSLNIKEVESTIVNELLILVPYYIERF